MRVNYDRLQELNRLSVLGINMDTQMSCYWLIQQGLERYLNGETITNEYVNFLTQMGVLVPETQDEKKKIVEPFNFTGNGPQGN